MKKLKHFLGMITILMVGVGSKIQTQNICIGDFEWIALVFISPHNNKNNSYHI